jgi:hypothetical protein
VPDPINILPLKRLSKGRHNKIIAQSKQPRSSQPRARILRVKARQRERRRAVRVDLRVVRPLREHRHLAGMQLGADDALLHGPVGGSREHARLGSHLCVDASRDDDEELGAAGVHVQGRYAAGGERRDRHAAARADQGREGLAVGQAGGGLGEVEDEVCVAEEGVAVDGSGCFLSQVLGAKGRRV